MSNLAVSSEVIRSSDNIYGSDLPTLGTTPTDDYYFDYTQEDSGLCIYPRHGATFLPAVYSLFFILGLLGNGLVLWVFLSQRYLRSVTDLCLLNLAVADLLLVASLPFLAHQARAQWVFGGFLCQAVLGVYRVGFYAGIFFLTLMSMDRYLAIVHAVYAMRARTRTFGLVAVAATWLAGVLASFPELANHREQSYNGTFYCAPEDDGLWWTRFSLYKMNVLGLLLPLAVIAFCYTQIVRRLLRAPSSKKQAIRLVVAVVVVFFCSWVPYNLASLFKALELSQVLEPSCEGSKALRLALQITETLAYFHSCLNPFLYVFVGEKFRRHLRRLARGAPCGVCRTLNTLLPQESRQASAYSLTTSMDERSTAV
ncbi:C-C chemokine receptor type 5-like [Aplochiton taeniatus]